MIEVSCYADDDGDGDVREDADAPIMESPTLAGMLLAADSARPEKKRLQPKQYCCVPWCKNNDLTAVLTRVPRGSRPRRSTEGSGAIGSLFRR